jgi:predicted nuclease of restriction endonuclease-like RecB superfamily
MIGSSTEPLRQDEASRLLPLYLTQEDRVWIEAVLDIYVQHIGRTTREVKAALTQADFYVPNQQKFRFVDLLMQELFVSHDVRATKLAQKIRAELFLRRASSADSIDRVVETVCKDLHLSKETMELQLFADIKSARRLSQPTTTIDVDEIRLKANLKQVQALLVHSEKILISMRGMSRPLIQCAKWLGLIVNISKDSVSGILSMEISGPLSILIHTKIYGHALGRLIPFLVLAEYFTFEATLLLREQRKTLMLRQGDPIFPKEGLKKFDSKLEQKFYTSFLKASDDWHLTRDPAPLEAGDGLVFPDFSLRHKVWSDLIWYLEIVGFWTPEYLTSKIKKYALVADSRLILCINEKFRAELKALPMSAEIVWYKTVLKPEAVLERVSVTIGNRLQAVNEASIPDALSNSPSTTEEA